MTNDERCGTNTGYGRHQKRDEKPCDACTAAKREYDRRWRSADKPTRMSRLRAKAQRRAYARLASLNPGLYQAFYDEERERLMREAGFEVYAFGRNGRRKEPLQ